MALLDDHAVDLMAKAMKTKLRLKREQGYGGWDDITKCTGERLAELLVAAVIKGDPVDVANFAMMLFCRAENHHALKVAYERAMPTVSVLSNEEIDVLIDRILHAAGSGLRHYSMQKTKADMRAAMRGALLARTSSSVKEPFIPQPHPGSIA
jgi:hypothetical protein